MPQQTVSDDLTLDPSDWEAMRKLGHQMMDDMMDYLQHIAEKPAWKPIPEEVKEELSVSIPQEPQAIESVYEEFKRNVFAYNKGNVHPRFFAWIQGTGTPFGTLSDLLASTMNPNVTIGEHSAMYVDKQVVDWCKEMLNFPKDASGILLSGGSMANITALTVARNFQTGNNIRKNGLKNNEKPLTLYCSTETHSCVLKAAEIIGLGTDSVRRIGVNDAFEMNIDELKRQLKEDIANGFEPFCVVGTAGTVNTGAIDPLEAIHEICKEFNLWFHIDGAYGALAKLDISFKDKLKFIENADSVAFDLHKWFYVPYEVGCALFKNAEAHKASFKNTPSYLLNATRGLSAGPESINNHGFELSRGFKALKVWMSIKEHGIKKYAALITQNNLQATYLGKLISETKVLEVMAPITLSIVCFRFQNAELSENTLNELNNELLIRLHEEGIALPSSTVLHNLFVIRVCIVNHRTKKSDLEMLVNESLRIGNQLLKEYNDAKQLI